MLEFGRDLGLAPRELPPNGVYEATLTNDRRSGELYRSLSPIDSALMLCFHYRA